MKVLEPGWITDRQIEAARVAITRFVKSAAAASGSGSFPTSPSPRSLRKPGWVRVRVVPEFWVAVVKPGRILYEMQGVCAEDVAREAIRLAGHKLGAEDEVRHAVRGGLIP